MGAPHEIIELRTLINQTEKLVEQLGKLLSTDEGNRSWLEWRHAGLERRLENTKRELRLLTEQLQVKILEDACVERQKRKHVVND